MNPYKRTVTVRETGKVLYTESSNTVITRNVNSTEEIKLIIKF